jgi:hypothetical protein
VFDSTPKTVGSLAERNNVGLGRYQVDAIKQNRIEKKKKAREVFAESLPSGMTAVGGTGEKPFWRGEKVDTGLASLTPTEKANYITTGSTNG